jgi:hypothetical protein
METEKHSISTGTYCDFVLLRRLLRVRLLMRLLTIDRFRSVFAVLNGHCLASLLRSLFSFGVVFRSFLVLCGMSYIKTAERFNVSHSVIVRLKQRVNQTESVKERKKDRKASEKSLQSLKFYLYCTCRY